MVDSQHRTFPAVPDERETRFLRDLLRGETLGGVLALAAALVAVVWANSRWADSYVDLQHLFLGPLDVEHWAADGALALFFFVVGLELKRELVVGSLRRPADAAVPVVAAICGVATPALIYLAVNLTASDGQPGGGRSRPRRTSRSRSRCWRSWGRPCRCRCARSFSPWRWSTT